MDYLTIWTWVVFVVCFVQFDLQSEKIIREIWTQGRDDPDGLYNEWVRSFRMSYSNTGVSWITYGYRQSSHQAKVNICIVFINSQCHQAGVAPETSWFRNYDFYHLTQKTVIEHIPIRSKDFFVVCVNSAIFSMIWVSLNSLNYFVFIY